MKHLLILIAEENFVTYFHASCYLTIFIVHFYLQHLLAFISHLYTYVRVTL